MTKTDETILIPRQAPGDRLAVPSTRHPKAIGYVSGDEASGQRGRALRTLAWSVPTIVMAVVVFIRASWPSLWADELATWGLATASWGELMRILPKTEATIGPYYVFMHGWTKVFGASDLALRLPSMLAMTGAAGLIGAIGSRLSGPRVGVIAGMLFALTPAVSRYGQEARPYALVVFFAVLATYLLVNAMDRPSVPAMVGYALAVALLGLAHVVALLLLAAHGLALLAVRRNLLWCWLLAVIPGLGVAGPLLYLGQRQQNQIAWIPELSAARLLQLPQGLAGSTLVGGMLLALAALAISTGRTGAVWSLWALAPTAGLALASLAIPLWLPRYLLFTLPAWVLLAATVAGRLPIVRGVLLLAVLAGVGLPDHDRMREVDGHNQASREVGAILGEHGLPADAVVYHAGASENPAVRDAVARYTDRAHLPKDVLLKVAARKEGNFRPVECDKIAECFGNPDRVWLIRLAEKTDAVAGLGKEKETLLRERYVVTETWRPKGFTVALLVRRPDPPATAA